MIESPIKVTRLLKGVSQDGLAKLTGYSQCYISLIEKAKRVPSCENLEIIAAALSCPVSVLCNGESKDLLMSELNSEIQNLSELEIEKTLDYVQTLKRGRR